MKKIRVLIVDDSALIRDLFTQILNEDDAIEVIGACRDPFEARDAIKQLNPDVITLDIEMPRMDGLSFLEKIMRLRPMPVIMVSSLTQKGADATIRALELGALDCIGKSSSTHISNIAQFQKELLTKIHTAVQARVSSRGTTLPAVTAVLPFDDKKTTRNLIAIGSSTGGVEALRDIIVSFPANTPPIAITQHMPERFTQSFAVRLNSLSTLTIKEAENDEVMRPGHCYIAPGGKHLEIKRNGYHYACRVFSGELVSGHCPSVDVLFNSVARVAGDKAVGVILTGMGSDGAKGLRAMLDAGATTLGQNEESCIVYGMPKAAKALGAVQTEAPLAQMAIRILQACTTSFQRARHGT